MPSSRIFEFFAKYLSQKYFNFSSAIPVSDTEHIILNSLSKLRSSFLSQSVIFKSNPNYKMQI